MPLPIHANRFTAPLTFFLGDYLLGSTADRVAHHAHCPVLIVK